MASICEFINSILPNSSSNIQAWSSLFTAGVALAAYFTAKKELNNWKIQKDHEIYLNKLGNIHVLAQAILRTTNDFDRILMTTSKYDDEFISKLSNSQSKLHIHLNELGFFNSLAILNELELTNKKYIKLLNYYKSIDKAYLGMFDLKVFPLYLAKWETLKNAPEVQNHIKVIMRERINAILEERDSFNPKD